MQLAERLFGAAWEMRRRCYALGLKRPRRVGAKVVSVGNLTIGGTGKTLLTLHLARHAIACGLDVAVVCKRYRPGPGGRGDEELLYAAALGEPRVFAGARKVDLAAQAARAGHDLVLVDDGFSHWALERDLDIVLLDAGDLWGGGRMLPAGRLREPRRALQRAEIVVVTRIGRHDDPAPRLAEVRRAAPSAWLAAARHGVARLRTLDGESCVPGRAARVVTATGNPQAVAASACEAGFAVTELSTYRDHHWFSVAEARDELARAAAAGACVVLTAKDAVRWPAALDDPMVRVLEVSWSWLQGGERVEASVVGPRTEVPK